MDVRVLIDEQSGRTGDGDLDDEQLVALYRPPRTPWWRVNMVSTADGSAAGADGRSGSINDGADQRVFDVLRATADAVLVGAGTARAEGYGPAAVPLVLVSRSARVPERLRGALPGAVLLATVDDAEGLGEAREVLGRDHVLTTGGGVDLPVLRRTLTERGMEVVLSEGGPSLLADLVTAQVLDEVCLTVVPRMVGGDHPRITAGPDLDAPLRLTTLLEQDGTLLGRWAVRA